MLKKIKDLGADEQLSRLRRRNVPLLMVGSAFMLLVAITNIPTENWWVALVLIPLVGFMQWRNYETAKAIKASPELQAMVKQVLAEKLEKAKSGRDGAAVKVAYQAGLDSMNLTLKAPYSLFATKEALVLERAGVRKEIPWGQVESVDAGTDDELRSRLTLTRVALIGIFALGAKKEKKQNFYVSISTKDSVGVFDLIASGKNQQIQAKARAFATSCNAKAKASGK